MMNLNTILIKNPGVVGRIVDGEAVLVLPEQGKVKVLNEVGGRIWALVNGTHTLGEIAAILCQEFEIDGTAALEDALAFASDLIEKDILLSDPG